MKKNESVDLYQLHKDEYRATRKPALVTIKPARYLTIQGQGEPGGELFQKKVGALYGVAFTMRSTCLIHAGPLLKNYALF
jgi:hypothetical protein